MRRGLMGRNESELPVAALEARLTRLRVAMQNGGLDSFLVYTNNVRPSAVTYLTGFTPYWSDALLLVGKNGSPVFATALSKRVSEWIRTTDPVSEILNTPKPGSALGALLAKDPTIKRVGVLELDTLPGGLYDEIAAVVPTVELVDATVLFASLRETVDETELGLLRKADAIAIAALDQVGGSSTTDAGTLAGLIEKHARLSGAEEIYVTIAPDLSADTRLIRIFKPAVLADRFAVRASVAYKGSWVRRTRTFAKDGSAAKADAWFADVVHSLAASKSIASLLAEKIKMLPGAELKGWMAEGCTGSYPLEVVASSRTPGNDTLANGQHAVLTVELSVAGQPWIGAAPLIVGKSSL
ncbi:aminopeptidase P family N-terminal domain-containing protein [Leptospira sp. severe_002]|uniref:aminopeptidase P family N-terminal domain-containing protein n=1 Tax=Leptospira sp. severe_002 TaxID=2838237 RepID=UPI001E5A37C4|nr:aminopeptidase P family N-terminal domain-containing protein [Leptospira sp. severe_002]